MQILWVQLGPAVQTWTSSLRLLWALVQQAKLYWICVTHIKQKHFENQRCLRVFPCFEHIKNESERKKKLYTESLRSTPRLFALPLKGRHRSRSPCAEPSRYSWPGLKKSLTKTYWNILKHTETMFEDSGVSWLDHQGQEPPWCVPWCFILFV